VEAARDCRRRQVVGAAPRGDDMVKPDSDQVTDALLLIIMIVILVWILRP
jgi:hypothetical protein